MKSLLNLLGWKEDVIYYNNKYYIFDSKLKCIFFKDFLFDLKWKKLSSVWNDDELDELMSAKEIEDYFILSLKPEYVKFFNLVKNSIYLNKSTSDNSYSLDTIVDIKGYKVIFSNEELKEIKLPNHISIEMFDIKRVDCI